MTKSTIEKIRLFSGVAMIAVAIIGFMLVTYTQGFDLASMFPAFLMGLIGWDLAFPEDSIEEDDDDYYEE